MLPLATSEQTSYRLLRLFYKSQSALILLLLLSKSQPLRWVAIWFRRFAAFLLYFEKISILTVLYKQKDMTIGHVFLFGFRLPETAFTLRNL